MALYLDLETQLCVPDSGLIRGKDSNQGNDRDYRMFIAMDQSKSADETLLKCCTQFTPYSDNGDIDLTAPEASVVQMRYPQVKVYLAKLYEAVKKAVYEKLRCGDKETQFGNWRRQALNGELGDGQATSFFRSSFERADQWAASQPPPLLSNLKLLRKQQLQKLQSQVSELNTITGELVRRLRMLRFFLNVDKLENWARGLENENSVLQACCQHWVTTLAELYMFGQCGHTKCQQCIDNSSAQDDRCGLDNCTGSAKIHHRIRVSHIIGSNQSLITMPAYHGRKIEDIVNLLVKIQARNEQALLFVQFSDLMHKIDNALQLSGIETSAVTGVDSHATAEDLLMKEFQEGRQVEGKTTKVTVMLLMAGTACASGQ